MNVHARSTDWSPGTLLLALLLAVTCFYTNLARDSYTDDFRAFYVAAVAQHDHLDPYFTHIDVSEKYADALWTKQASRFIYPPTALLFFSPLSHVPYKAAKIAWGLLMTLCMVGVLMALYRRFPQRPLLLLALFVTLPMFMNIDNGNIDCLILLLTLGAFWIGDRPWSGVCLGLAIVVKFSPLLLLLWFAGNRRWRTVASTCVTVIVAGGVAYLRFGAGYFNEFLPHMLHHEDAGLPEIRHVFTTIQKVQERFLLTPDGPFAYQHDIGGYAQNPLHWLGHAGSWAGLLLFGAYAAWSLGSKMMRRLSPEQSFFLFLVVALIANPMLWAMGLVACFPLIVLLVSSSGTPNKAAVLLIVPFLLTKQIAGELNFTLWLLAAGYCVWQSGWLRKQPEHGGVPASSLPVIAAAP